MILQTTIEEVVKEMHKNKSYDSVISDLLIQIDTLKSRIIEYQLYIDKLHDSYDIPVPEEIGR